MSAIRVVLTLPVLRLGVGPFAIDPLEHLVGAKVSDLLGPLMTGPVTQRRTEAGVLVDVYPLALPEGEGATVPLGGLGELGFFNARGLLVLTVPAAAASWVAARLGAAVVERAEGRSLDGRSRVVALTLRLHPGARAAWPLGGMGEVGVEAAAAGSRRPP